MASVAAVWKGMSVTSTVSVSWVLLPAEVGNRVAATWTALSGVLAAVGDTPPAGAARSDSPPLNMKRVVPVATGAGMGDATLSPFG